MVFPSLLHLVFGLGLWLPLPDPMPSHTLATLYCAFPFTFPKWSETDTSQPKLKSHPLLLFCSEPLTASSTSGSFPTPKPESGAQVAQQATHKPPPSTFLRGLKPPPRTQNSNITIHHITRFTRITSLAIGSLADPLHAQWKMIVQSSQTQTSHA